MWRSHFVVLRELPTASALAQLAEGYQLFQETRTGLHYLTAHRKPPNKRPDFGGFLEREIKHRADLAAVQQFLAQDYANLALKSYEVSSDLIHQAATLSMRLAVPVLAAEVTDDEYAMAVLADKGEIAYLRFRTTQKSGAEEADLVEVSYSPAAGFIIAPPAFGQMCGLAQTAIADVFAVSGVDLDRYTDRKPTRGAGRREATQLGMPVESWLDSFGVFMRVSHAPPRLTLATRLLIPLRYAAALLLLPFLFVGTVVFAIVYAGKPGADWDVSGGRLSLIGLAVLAIPILLVVWAIRAILG